jgi:hypothetical protein
VVALLAVVASVAEATQVQLRVEPSELVAGQTGVARVTIVSGGRGDPRANTSRPPPLPAGDGLQVGYSHQGSAFKSINGVITQIQQYDYRVTALQEGSWTIGPVELVLDDGSTIRAEPVSVKVGPRPEIGVTRDEIAVEAGFDVEEAWEGQVVLYRYRFQTTHIGATAEWRLPDFDGLRFPQHGQATSTGYTIDDPEGAIQVQEGFVPLIATGTGRRDQGAAVANVKVPIGRADLFGFRRVRSEPWATERAELLVEPLPPAPPGFSGLVGDFEVLSALDRAEAVVGQSVAWTVRVVGNGAVGGFSLPPYEAPGASVYDEDAQVAARVEGQDYVASATFRRVFVPTDEGELAPPPLELITFSPTRGEYVTHRVELPAIAVSPGKEGAGQVTSFAGDGPTFSEADASVTAPRALRGSGRDTVWALSAALPVLLPLAALPGLIVLGSDLVAFLARRRRERLAARAAPIKPSSLLRDLPQDEDERWAAMDAALRLAEAAGADVASLRKRLNRVRFGGAEADPGLEEAIRRAVTQAEEAA